MKGESYTCAMCGGNFLKARSDEVALAEMTAEFGPSFSKDDCDTVCEDCFKKIDPANHPHRVEEAIREHAKITQFGQMYKDCRAYRYERESDEP